MAQATATVPTENGSKYLQQLCKHWSHKLTVEFDAQKGTVTFPNAVATMEAQPASLLVTVEAPEAETVERMKGVVADHLNRFAFREAPLPFDWQ
ncbi:DUF2218 domain-containing protein [Sphingobium sp. SCG-1]|uniref:DUF2218 domain-containing protein n=1 Tax=Sphingobium sp. SCG-1 TaxID=2072936 RepID=UPI000CD683BB|nr:DUF2218 domain-containing protein [Sphingobium sp. SCG-1]AUW58142.1 DUF2218 domain-containing protein [Sphingobium sp. SCG-1]